MSKGNSSLRVKRGKEGSDLLKNRVLKNQRVQYMEKKTKHHRQQVVKGIPTEFLVSKVPTYELSTVIPQRTIELVRVLWVPVNQMEIIRPL